MLHYALLYPNRPGLNHIEQDLAPVVISRDLFDEQYRRQLISNVAKHALFSKCGLNHFLSLIFFAECKLNIQFFVKQHAIFMN